MDLLRLVDSNKDKTMNFVQFLLFLAFAVGLSLLMGLAKTMIGKLDDTIPFGKSITVAVASLLIAFLLKGFFPNPVSAGDVVSQICGGLLLAFTTMGVRESWVAIFESGN